MLGIAAVALLIAMPTAAQVQDALRAYTGVNAEGYMQPAADAFAANINDAFYYSAYIPETGLKFSFELAAMSVIFGDDDKTFQAQTEGGFLPPTTFTAPTIVGATEAVTVTSQSGAKFSAPGGFDLNSFAIAVPQLRIGAFKGTEAVVRFFAADISDNEFSEIDLFGIGVRHSISQYFESPVGLAVGAMWQKFQLGDNFIDTNAFTFGVQTSKRFSLLEPYGGLSWDSFKMDVTFDSEATGSPTTEKISFDRANNIRATIGLGLDYSIGHAFVEYNISSTNSFAFGLTLGN
jgi:hypothetical protein